MRYSTHYNRVLNAVRERGATLSTELATFENGQNWVVLCEDDQLAGGKVPMIVAHGVQVSVSIDRIATVPLCRTAGVPVYVVAETREEASRMVVRMIEKGYQTKLTSLKPDTEGEESALSAPAKMQVR